MVAQHHVDVVAQAFQAGQGLGRRVLDHRPQPLRRVIGTGGQGAEGQGGGGDVRPGGREAAGRQQAGGLQPVDQAGRRAEAEVEVRRGKAAQKAPVQRAPHRRQGGQPAERVPCEAVRLGKAAQAPGLAVGQGVDHLRGGEVDHGAGGVGNRLDGGGGDQQGPVVDRHPVEPGAERLLRHLLRRGGAGRARHAGQGGAEDGQGGGRVHPLAQNQGRRGAEVGAAVLQGGVPLLRPAAAEQEDAHRPVRVGRRRGHLAQAGGEGVTPFLGIVDQQQAAGAPGVQGKRPVGGHQAGGPAGVLRQRLRNLVGQAGLAGAALARQQAHAHPAAAARPGQEVRRLRVAADQVGEAGVPRQPRQGALVDGKGLGTPVARRLDEGVAGGRAAQLFGREPQRSTGGVGEPLVQVAGVQDVNVPPHPLGPPRLGPGTLARPFPGGDEDEGGLRRVEAKGVRKPLRMVVVGLGARIRANPHFPGRWTLGHEGGAVGDHHPVPARIFNDIARWQVEEADAHGLADQAVHQFGKSGATLGALRPQQDVADLNPQGIIGHDAAIASG